MFYLYKQSLRLMFWAGAWVTATLLLILGTVALGGLTYSAAVFVDSTIPDQFDWWGVMFLAMTGMIFIVPILVWAAKMLQELPHLLESHLAKATDTQEMRRVQIEQGHLWQVSEYPHLNPPSPGGFFVSFSKHRLTWPTRYPTAQ